MNIKSKLEFTYVVGANDLAYALSSEEDDNFPKVFATSRMIALMELAAARMMRPLLRAGELSVGVNVNVDHIAATPEGEEVKVSAVYTGQSGKLFEFEVFAYDRGGKIGYGSHSRAIVNTARLVEGANSRVKT